MGACCSPQETCPSAHSQPPQPGLTATSLGRVTPWGFNKADSSPTPAKLDTLHTESSLPSLMVGISTASQTNSLAGLLFLAASTQTAQTLSCKRNRKPCLKLIAGIYWSLTHTFGFDSNTIRSWDSCALTDSLDLALSKVETHMNAASVGISLLASSLDSWKPTRVMSLSQITSGPTAETGLQ